MLLFCGEQNRKTFVLVTTKYTLLLVYASCCLGEARLSSRHVAPLLHNRLLDLPGVPPGPGAHLLGDVDTLLGGLEEGHKLGDVPALTLGLKVASLLRNLLDNSCLLVKAFLLSNDDLKSGATELKHNRLALGLGGVLGDTLGVLGTFPPGPLGTLLLGGVTLGHILALLILDIHALHNIILNIVGMLPGGASALGHLLTLLTTILVAQRGVALLDGLLNGNLLVLDETVLPEVLCTILLLLGLEVGGVGGVTLIGVAMLALNVVVVLGLLNHDNLVNATLTSSSDGTNVQVNVISLALTGSPGIKVHRLSMVGMVVVVVIVSTTVGPGGSIAPGVEGEGVDERFSTANTTLLLSSGCARHKDQQANLGNSNHD